MNLKDHNYINEEIRFLLNNNEIITWEDIRLYLESKGFTLIQAIDNNNKDYYCINVWQWKDDWEGELLNSFVRDTYEECRTASIKYCLNLIKE